MSLCPKRGLLGLAVAALFGAAGLASNADAQCTNYMIAQGTGTIVPGVDDTGNHIDDGQTDIALPFAWAIYGTVYNDVNVCSNGNLQFGVPAGTFPAAYTNDCLPSPAQITGPMICPHWDDLLTTNAGEGIFTSTSGSAPNRIFNIEWRTHFFSQTGTANFEVRLYEGLPRFDVIYGEVDPGGISATVGCQASSAGPFTQFECNTGGINSGLMLTFDCPTTYPPSCSLTTSPSSGGGGSSFTAFATVLPGGGPTSTGLAVSLDASGVGGGTVALHDDGLPPDVTAGDHVFSGTVTVGAATPLGGHSITSTASDAQGRSSTCSTSFSVTPSNCTSEEEPCGVNNPDTFDGGCNSVPPVYATATFGTVYCGTAANSTAARDTDWWMFTLPSPDTVTVTGQAQFLAQWFILAPTCPANILSPIVDNTAGNPDMTLTFGPLPAGDYVFFCSPQTFNGDVACDTNGTYWFEIDRLAQGSCCTGGQCSIVSQSTCAAQGGVFGGVGSQCPLGAGHSYASDPNLAIPDAGAPVTDTITVPDNFNLGHVAVHVTIPDHTYVSDLQIDLTHGANTVRVWDHECGANDGLDVTFDDSGAVVVCAQPTAGTYTPAMPLAVLGSGSASGPWTLTCQDTVGGDVGTLTHWDLTLSEPASCGPHCGSADFNCDGDVGTDQDIEGFFACLAGSCPAPPCTSTADFNGDGDIGTDQDIEAFFRVLGGGNC